MGGIMNVVRAEFPSEPRENHHDAPAQARELVDRMSTATNALEQAHRQRTQIKGLL
jgi:hypothetical protein